MVELQIVVLAVAGSSPVGHPRIPVHEVESFNGVIGIAMRAVAFPEPVVYAAP